MTNFEILNLLALAKVMPSRRGEVIDRLHALFDEVVEREKYYAWKLLGNERAVLLDGEEE
jgi:hypothetical protein